MWAGDLGLVLQAATPSLEDPFTFKEDVALHRKRKSPNPLMVVALALSVLVAGVAWASSGPNTYAGVPADPCCRKGLPFTAARSTSRARLGSAPPAQSALQSEGVPWRRRVALVQGYGRNDRHPGPPESSNQPFGRFLFGALKQAQTGPFVLTQTCL
jgi:hypothetical protein